MLEIITAGKIAGMKRKSICMALIAMNDGGFMDIYSV
jgi:hypothetical protein